MALKQGTLLLNTINPPIQALFTSTVAASRKAGHIYPPTMANNQLQGTRLYDPNLLKPSRFLTPLRVRSGMTSDKVTLNKLVPQSSAACHKCYSGVETLAHILEQCIYTKPKQI
jgi:hypothetical protein